MNAVEIEEAVSALASAPFDPAAFPYAFLTAFGVKDTTIARLRKGDTNASDVGGVLQRGNIHIAVAVPGGMNDTLRALRDSPKTATAKAKFILVTDGQTLEAEDLISGEPLACPYHEFADHFGFFLPLAGISTVKELKNNPIDVKATGRLNRLYVELLKENAEWGTPERRHDLNQFMTRLIFCFFAEDTGIFNGTNLFTSTLERMSTTEAGSVEHVLTELFRAMDIAPEKRQDAKLRSWADAFPYVNGGLFAGGKPCPRFSKIARSYLLRAGELNWREINPDIFGSMIQAVADEGERGSLGMHYTSVPNIMKVLGPLFLDDLHAHLEAAGDNVRKLRNLRRRLANIRVFDPACGSGNFLVIAYIRMREIEHEIVKLTDDEPRSMIPLSNFYGIEIKDFAAEIARLALLIAEFQCDVRFIDQHVARSLVLPLKKTGQIKTGNALHEDWLKICPSAKSLSSDNLSGTDENGGRVDKVELEDINPTFICGNPPYLGGKSQSVTQKNDMSRAFGAEGGIGELDYIAAWFIKAAFYIKNIEKSAAAFVATNSLNQGSQVHQLWPKIAQLGLEIKFCHRSFKWSNSARNNAAVICNIIGIGLSGGGTKLLFDGDIVQEVNSIGPYLVPNNTAIVHQSLSPMNRLPKILTGNSPYDGGNLLLSIEEKIGLLQSRPEAIKFIRPLSGSVEFINGLQRYCLWIEDKDAASAEAIPEIKKRIENVRKSRSTGGDVARGLVKRPHKFRYTHTARSLSIIVPRVSSASRDYIPFGILDQNTIISDSAQAIYDPDLWVLSIMLSRMHMCWVRTVSGKLKNDIRYASALCYNTFPIPKLTEQEKYQLTMNAESILLSREESFPSTLAEMYDSEKMPEDLRRAHEKNDETVERIYIGRRFRNDTERLEKLFELYTRMTAAEAQAVTAKKPAGRGRSRAAAGAV